jgi:hypothetical protein
VVKEALECGTDGVCSCTDINHGTSQEFLLFHAVWIFAAGAQPMLHHVLPNIRILLSSLDSSHGRIEDMIARGQIELVDERIGEQVVV